MHCVCPGMALLFWMLEHLGACKGFFTIKPAKRLDGVHTQAEVDAYVLKCVTEDAMRPLMDKGGIGHMWVEEDQRKHDAKGDLFRMWSDAERQQDMGYLTPCMLAVLDTRLYCAMRGGVNGTFGKGGGEGTTSNQPPALLAHDAFLRDRVKYHYV